MIASLTHNFVFIKLRKTAGTSIELALSSLCGESDIITPLGFEDERIRLANGWPGPQNFTTDSGMMARYRDVVIHGDDASYRAFRNGARQRGEYHNHMPAKRVRRMLGSEFWNRAHKWTVERHPYEKAVSRAYFKIWIKGLPADSFQDALDEVIDNGQIEERQLYTIEGKLAVDEVIRFEDLPTAFHSVLAKSGLRFDGALPRAKISQRRDRRPAREILSERQKKAIYASCGATFDLLHYEP